MRAASLQGMRAQADGARAQGLEASVRSAYRTYFWTVYSLGLRLTDGLRLQC